MSAGTTETARDSSLKIEKLLLTYEELSEATGFKRRKLQQLVVAKMIPHVRIGRHVRFEKDAVAKWLKKFRS